MENTEIASVFDEIADILEIQGENEFRVRSYRRAARTIRDHPRRMEDLAAEGQDFKKLPGIGKSIADHVAELLETGKLKRLEEVREGFPEHLRELMKVPGLGPKKVKLLHEALGLESLEDLEKAAKEGRIRGLEGMGEKTEENILEGLKTVASGAGRTFLKIASDRVESLGRLLDGLEAVKRWTVAGSFRRRKETVGDLDILVEASDREAATEGLLAYEGVAEVVQRGVEKVTVRMNTGLQVDFRFFESSSFGAASMYFTGSKAHNIRLRTIARDRGWKINEYGLFKGERLLAGRTEEAIYRRLGLDWVPPELREDRGEVEAASEDALPDLVGRDAIRGDLHMHTVETDGRNTLSEMVEAARKRGYDYVAITDHSKAVAVARGMDEKRLQKRADVIRDLDRDVEDIRVFPGVEVDILKSGRLDLDEDLLAELDWVTASVHSHFDLPEKAMTARVLSAIESGVVHAISHPTGREIGKREPIALDLDRVFEAAAASHVCLEINAYPNRLDLPDIYCKRAAEAGVTLVICTDAHSLAGLSFMPYGVDVARRGWLERKDVLNTRTLKQVEKHIAKIGR